MRKGLRLYAYVVMTNHFHAICRTEPGDALPAVMRDLKRHTSRELVRQLREDGRHDIVEAFRRSPDRRPGNTEAKVWQDGYHPILLTSEEWFLQKLEYLESNPVRKGYAVEPEGWKYSSARNRLLGDDSVLAVDPLYDD